MVKSEEDRLLHEQFPNPWCILRRRFDIPGLSECEEVVAAYETKAEALRVLQAAEGWGLMLEVPRDDVGETAFYVRSPREDCDDGLTEGTWVDLSISVDKISSAPAPTKDMEPALVMMLVCDHHFYRPVNAVLQDISFEVLCELNSPL